MNPTPSPSPNVLHVVVDGGSPVWQQPLLTGVFVLVAAMIALVSLWLSDRRKLAREDRRQWDTQIQQAYVAIHGEVTKVRIELSRVRRREDPRPPELLVTLEEAMTLVSERTTLLETFAPQAVILAAKTVGAKITATWQTGFLQVGEELDLNWAMKAFLELDAPLDELRDRVREALRV